MSTDDFKKTILDPLMNGIFSGSKTINELKSIIEAAKINDGEKKLAYIALAEMLKIYISLIGKIH